MPVPGSGLGAQFSMAEESTWGTAVTTTRFIPVDTCNVKLMKKTVQGQGLQAGTYIEQGQLRADTSYWAAGDVEVDYQSKGMGLFLKYMLGANTSALSSTPAYTQTAVLGSATNGLGLTLQYGAPQANAAATVTPFTVSGAKITSWELSNSAQDILKLKATFIGQNVVTSTSLATASYPTASNIFYFKQGSLNIGGSPYLAFRDFTLTGDNGLSDDRFYFGNNGLLAEPIRKDFTKLTFAGTADFIDTTLSSAYAADTELSIVLTFGGAGLSKQLVTTYYEQLTITLNGVRVNGDVPTIAGPDLLSIPFSADIVTPIAGGTPITISQVTLDAAV